MGLHKNPRIHLTLPDGKRLRTLVYSYGILQNFNTSLGLKDSICYDQTNLSSTGFMSCFDRFSTAAGTPAQKLTNVHGRLLQFQFLALHRETNDCYLHSLLGITSRSATPVLEEFFEGKGIGTEPLACQRTLTFPSERRGLKSSKKREKEVFICSHTREHRTGLVSARSATGGRIN